MKLLWAALGASMVLCIATAGKFHGKNDFEAGSRVVSTPEPREFIDACDRPYLPYCEESWWAPDSEDCRYFWKCYSGFWGKLTCQEGTFFDTITYTCVAEDFVCQEECPPYTGPPPPDPTAQPGGTCPWVDEFNCQQNQNYQDSVVCDVYYLCNNNALLYRECALGTLFDINTRMCISPYPGFNCDPRCPAAYTTDALDQKAAAVTEKLVNAVDIQTESSDIPVSGTPEPRELIDACDRPYLPYCEASWWAPDYDDCRDFWRCASGFWVKQRCQEGAFFDTITYTCLAEDYVCQHNCPPYTGPPPADPTVQPGGTCPWVDEYNCQQNQNYQDSVVCDVYYLCSNNALLYRECALGTLFDINTRRCISPYPGFNCDPRCPKEYTGTSDAPATEQITDILTTRETPETTKPADPPSTESPVTQGPPDEECDGKQDGEWLENSDCTRAWVCVDNRIVFIQCDMDRGFVVDNDTLTCKLFYEATGQCRNTKSCYLVSPGTYPICDLDCTWRFTCIGGQNEPYYEQCGTEGTSYDFYLQRCDWPQNVCTPCGFRNEPECAGMDIICELGDTPAPPL